MQPSLALVKQTLAALALMCFSLSTLADMNRSKQAATSLNDVIRSQKKSVTTLSAYQQQQRWQAATKLPTLKQNELRALIIKGALDAPAAGSAQAQPQRETVSDAAMGRDSRPLKQSNGELAAQNDDDNTTKSTYSGEVKHSGKRAGSRYTASAVRIKSSTRVSAKIKP